MKIFYLLRYACLAFPLAFAGLPVYVHVPAFYAQVMKVDLAQLGVLVFVLRLGDTIIDPFIGLLSDRFQAQRKTIVVISAFVLGAGYFLLFSPPDSAFAFPLLWLGLTLCLVYLAFSTLMINYYAYGLQIAGERFSAVTVSAWREGTMLAGVLLASLLPPLLMQHYDMQHAYRIFALLPAPLLAAASLISFSGYYPPLAAQAPRPSFRVLLQNRKLSALLVLAFLNNIPSAITSTLFMFFVADILQAPDQSGFMLAVYFMSAAAGTVLWSALAHRVGKSRSLLSAMVISIMVFIWAWNLGQHDVWNFYLICILSGITMAADMVLLPAMFADSLAPEDGLGASAFGLWNLVSKLSIACAAGLVLPLLSVYGYRPGGENTIHSLAVLSFCYALLPCLFKAVAIGYLYKKGELR